MTTFAEMQLLVNGITKRPELVAVTDAAIKLATLRAHHVDFFIRDSAVHEFTYVVDSSAIYQSKSTLFTDIPLLRIPSYLLGTDSAGVPTEKLEFVKEFTEFWDEDNNLKSSVFTFVGETLRARFLSATGFAHLYYYKNPQTISASYSSWIANLHPEELALWAAAIVWNRSGNQEQAMSTLRDHVAPFKELLVTAYLMQKI